MPNDEYLETLLRIDRKERLLSEIIVWLRTKKLFDECMTDLGQEQLIKKPEQQ